MRSRGQEESETMATKRKRKSIVVEGGRRLTRLQAKINALPQESFTTPSPTPEVLSRAPAASPTSSKYSSLNAELFFKRNIFSRSAKRSKEPENVSESRPEISANDHERSEGHSSSDHSPPYQTVIDNILKSLSPRQLGSTSVRIGLQREHVIISPTSIQAMRGTKIQECRDTMLTETIDVAIPTVGVINNGKIPSTLPPESKGSKECEINNPSSALIQDIRMDMESTPLASNTVTTEQALREERAMASNVVEDRLGESSNTNLSIGHLNRTLSFGLSEMVNMWGDKDSDLDEAESPALVTILGYRVKEAFASTIRSIINKYGDIATKYFMKTPEGRSVALENLSEFIQTFQTKKFCELPQLEIEKALAYVHDFRTAGLDVDWLHQRLKDILEAKQLIKQSSILKERRDISNQVIKEKKRELEVYEPQLLALQEKVNFAKKELDAAQAEDEAIRKIVSNAKAKVRYFVDYPPLDGLL